MYSNFPVDGRLVRARDGEVKIGDGMVYAVIESGGKQYKATEGEYLEVDLLPEDLGKKKVFDKVLLLVNGEDTLVGSPYLPEVSIETKVSEHFKGPKIIIFNYRAKERYRVKTGHRQKYTRLLVESIKFPGKPKDSKAVEEVVTPAKKARTKPATKAKKPVEKAVKTKSEAAKPAKKAVKKVATTKTK
jgi:large subunit ribosomal protein L21